MKPIWIVDDDQSIRFVLEKALAREDLEVRSFTNSRDVLAALLDDKPQVLVSDIRMPGGSGIELLGKIKERHPGLPVIVMTAYSDLDSAVSAFQGGAFEYLPKPNARNPGPSTGDARRVSCHRALEPKCGHGADHG